MVFSLENYFYFSTDNKRVNGKIRSFLVFFLFFPFLLPAQEVLRGEVRVELEPIFGSYIDEEYPLDKETAYRRALQEAALFFSAQIYGWSFHYDVGERARGIKEVFELNPLGEIRWGDPGLNVTHANFENWESQPTSYRFASFLSAWMDYRPTDSQRRRLEMWQKGNIRFAQAVGYSYTGGPMEDTTWLAIKKNALEDSARAAVRAMLQGSERNRPKEVTGFISLESFPSFFMDSGRQAAQARFKVEITEIIPFSAY
jgi:hypothetical protein